MFGVRARAAGYTATALVFIVLSPALLASDIATTQSFADGDSITAAKMNNIIGNATIQAGSITDRSTATPVTTDSLSYYQASSGSLKKMTISALLALGVASQTFTGTTNISERIDFAGDITPTALSGDVNDYAPTGLSTASTLRLSSNASRTITGLTGGSDGRILFVHNVGSNDIILKDNSSSSSAANRFMFYRDMTLAHDTAVILQYDSTAGFWRAFQRDKGLTNYLQFVAPHRVDGTGAVLQTTSTAIFYGQALFSATAAATANYVEYRFVVPEDLDTSVDLTAKFKFYLSNTDTTGTHRYIISVADVADSAVSAGTLGNAVNLDYAADSSGANTDVETVGPTTLTGWKGALTAGHLMVIRVARDGTGGATGHGTSTVASYSSTLEIAYTSLQ